ncbi:MAG: response regulator [Breznakia sp.]
MNIEICKILIVDDEYIIRQGIVHFLDWEKHGFTIIGEASNGREALTIIEREKPHIVLCDIVMPDIDGFSLSRKIREKYPDIKIIVLSSYDDFDKVKEMFLSGAADYILKPTLNQETLLDSLQKVRATIERINFSETKKTPLASFLTQMLLGFSNMANLEDAFLDYAYYYLVLIHRKGLSQANHLDRFYTDGLTAAFFDREYCLLRISDEIHAVLFASNEKFDIEEKLSNVGIEYIPECILSLSKAFSNLSALADVYEILLSSLDYRFYLQSGNLICERTNIKFTALAKFDLHLYNDLLYRLQLKDALKILSNFVEDALQMKNNPRELKALIGNCLYSFITIMEEHQINSDYIHEFKLTTLSSLDSSIDAQALTKELKKIINDLNVVVDNYHFEKNDDIMNKIIKYIHLHYQKPLSLQTLADEFNFSYSYLSAYFNERSELSFNEYLNTIRVNKAAELLRSGQMSISEVGYEVGFSDHSYFCKVFKKQIGVTPSVYRRGGAIYVG